MTDDPVHRAAEAAIDQLIALLIEARGYLTTGNDLAAVGTLVVFDDNAEDVRAAMRLLRMTGRRRR